MWNLLYRICTHPFDYWALLRTKKISFIKSEQENEGVYSFYFKIPKGVTWKAGQHAIFSDLPNCTDKKQWRVFSIASNTAEQCIQITTNIPPQPSLYKQSLLQLKPGDQIKIRGPVGEFHVENAKQIIVGIAGGIGITPFRALLGALATESEGQNDVHLIYGGKNGVHLFKKELMLYTKSSSLTIEFLNTQEEVSSAIDATIQKYGSAATYFISGSPNMLTAIRKKLNQQGVSDIVTDPFKGY